MAETIQVEIHGVPVDFPASMSPEELQQAVSQAAQQMQQTDQPDPPVEEWTRVPEEPYDGGKMEALGGAARSGLMMGWDDEARALAGAAWDGGLSNLGSDKMWDDYSKRQLELDRVKTQREKAYPGTSIAGEIGGSLIMPGGLAKLGIQTGLKAGAGLGKRVLAGTGVGAGSGAVAGAGDAEQGLGNRLTGAGVGATVGGIVGGALPAVTDGAGALTRAIRDKMASPKKIAGERVAESFIDDAQFPEGRMSEADILAANRSGAPTYNFDRGGESVRALARGASNLSPASGARPNRAVDKRFGEQSSRIDSFLSNLTDGGIDDIDLQDELLTAARNINKPAYDAAYNYNLGTGQGWAKMQPFLDKIPAEAIRNAERIARAEGRPFGENLIGAIDDATGKVTFSREPSFAEWDSIQRGLRSAKEKLYRGGDTDVATSYNGLHKSLLSTMDEVNPLFKTARGGAARAFGVDDAMEAGRKFAKSRGEASARQSKAIDGLNDVERRIFRIGYISEVQRKLSERSTRQNTAAQILAVPADAARHRKVLGERDFKDFQKTIKVETALDAARQIWANSTTMKQKAVMDRIKDMAGSAALPLTPAMAAMAMTGGDVSMGSGVAGVSFLGAAGARKLAQRKLTGISQEIMDTLMSQDPAKVQRLVVKYADDQDWWKTFKRNMVSVENLAKVPGSQMAAQGLSNPDKDLYRGGPR